MKLVNKTLALFLAGSLLGQTALFAAPANRETTPKIPLRVVQAQAQRDARYLEEAGLSWKIGFPIAGLFVGGWIVLNFEYHRRLENENRQLRQAIQDLKQENHFLTNQSNGREKGRLLTHEKLNKQKVRNAQLERHYQEEISALKLSLERTHSALEHAASFNYAVDQEVALFLDKPKTMEFFAFCNTSVPPQGTAAKQWFATREALAKEALQGETWFTTKLSDAERNAFLEIFLDISHHRDYALRENRSFELVSFSFKRFMIQHTQPGVQYMSAFYRNFFTKKNLLGLTLMLYGASSVSAAAQEGQDNQMAVRIENNFDLFLQASEEELNTMQQNPVTYQTCIRNAAMLNELTAVAPEDLQRLQTATRRPQITTPQLRPVRAR